MKHHVFLSYSRKDTDIMHRVCDDLRAAGLTVWTDEGIEPGTPSWRKAIENAIENSDCLVVLLSPESKASEWIERELDYAHTCGVTAFPVLARGDERNAVPLELITVQHADIRTDYPSGIEQLVTAIQKHIRLENQAPRQRTPQTTPDSALPVTDEAELDPWNLLDQFRLLWWLFLTPSRLAAYSARTGKESVRKTGFWLVSTLAWFPIVMPILGYALGTVQMPEVAGLVRVSMILVVILLTLGWIIPGWLGKRDDHTAGVVAFIVTGVTAFVAIGVLGGAGGVVFSEVGGMAGALHTITTGIGIGVAFGVAFAVASKATGLVSGVLVGTIVFAVVFNKSPGAAGGLAGVAMVLTAIGVALSLQNNLETSRFSWWSRGVAAGVALNYGASLWLYFLGGWQVLVAAGL